VPAGGLQAAHRIDRSGKPVVDEREVDGPGKAWDQAVVRAERLS
jgi:hypothetical protein